MAAHTPLDRLGEPEDVAVPSLVSPVAAWIGGPTLFVNGGRQTLGEATPIHLSTYRPMIPRFLLLALAFTAGATGAAAQDLSTHVLDLARGVGGAGVPVSLEVETPDGWALVGRATTAESGRVESFPRAESAPEADGPGLYRLTFDLRDYWEGLGLHLAESSSPPLPFFPEVTVVFHVADPTAHTHVPVVVSPYGYSTYRGN